MSRPRLYFRSNSCALAVHAPEKAEPDFKPVRLTAEGKRCRYSSPDRRRQGKAGMTAEVLLRPVAPRWRPAGPALRAAGPVLRREQPAIALPRARGPAAEWFEFEPDRQVIRATAH